MRSDVIKVYKSLHTWTGLLGGMALFICFYAGSLTMFEEPLDRWATPPQQQAHWVAQEQWPQLIRAVLDKHPAAMKSFTLHVEKTENAPAPLVWREKNGEETISWRATLTPSGELDAQPFTASPMAQLIDTLHQTAGIPGEGHHNIGVYVMGGISVLYVLAIVSGLIILLPTLVKDFFAVRRGKNVKRFWLDAHNVIGITSIPFHLVIGLTVIVFAFHDQIYDSLGKIVYEERATVARGAQGPTEKTHSHEELMMPNELMAAVATIAPGFVAREINYNGALTDKASVRISGEDTRYMIRGANRGFVTMKAYSGEITDRDYLPGHEQGWINIVLTFFALHFGNFGGYPVRWIYFLLGLGGAFLFYSGNLLWIESRRRKQRRDALPVAQQRNTQLMAAATVSVCWGSVAGVAAAMVAGKWFYDSAADMSSLYMWTYYSVFLGSIVWAFWRGAPIALIHLLWLCAATCMAIPLTGLAALIFPDIKPWLHTNPELLVVEFTALIIGLVFAVMAQRTRARVRHGNTDSVWSEKTLAQDLRENPHKLMAETE